MSSILSRSGWIAVGILALFVIATMTSVVRGGPLDPPGAPGPTQPQVEPRTPISTLPFTITQSGSYFVTKNLSSGGAGISVQASNVTIDLDGFTLSGTQSVAAINVLAGPSGLVVRNGTLDGWLYGVNSSSVGNSRFEQMQIRGANIPINATGAGNVIDHVRADGVTGYGFWLGDRAIVSNCRLDHVAASNNLDYGVIGGTQSVITHCEAEGFGFGMNVGDQSQITDCDVRNGGSRGVKLGTASSVEGCTIASYPTGIEAHQGDRVVNSLIYSSGSFAVGVLVQGQYLRIEGNQIVVGDNGILGGYGISFDAGANGSTVLGNRIHILGGGVPINQGGTTNDIGPLQSAATGTSPNANILY